MKLEAHSFDCSDDFDEYNWTQEVGTFTITSGIDNTGSAEINEKGVLE